MCLPSGVIRPSGMIPDGAEGPLMSNGAPENRVLFSSHTAVAGPATAVPAPNKKTKAARIGRINHLALQEREQARPNAVNGRDVIATNPATDSPRSKRFRAAAPAC